MYGIPNCDQVKKARTWLAEQQQPFQFHDVKKAGLDPEMIRQWLTRVTWETLINRKGTTWRALSDARKAAVTDDDSAIALMLEAPSVIKRPVLVTPAHTVVGFSVDVYQSIFKK
jgi:arsenate reductase